MNWMIYAAVESNREDLQGSKWKGKVQMKASERVEKISWEKKKGPRTEVEGKKIIRKT